MPREDFLVEVVETTTINVEVPAHFQIVVEDQIADNAVEIEVHTIDVVVDLDGPPDMRLELMDGELFIATNDGLLGTRLRSAYGLVLTQIPAGRRFQIPFVATKIFGFYLNGIDYVENVVLTPGEGIVTFTPSPDGGYAPQVGDFLLITYSE